MNWLLCSDDRGNPALINLNHVERIWIANDYDGEWSVVASTATDSYTLFCYDNFEEANMCLIKISNTVESIDIQRQIL